MSHTNMILYGAVLPTYNKKDKAGEDVIDADDPANRDRVNAILNSFD